MTDEDTLTKYDSIDDSALQRAATSLTKRFQTRLAREMAGATMAGYDALDVVRNPQPLTGDLEDALTLKAAFIPRRDAEATVPTSWDGLVERYPLTDLDRESVRELRRIGRGDAWGDDDG